MLQTLYSGTARLVNLIDGLEGRRVWYQYWDKTLTHQGSYLARLKYVMNNPVKHKLVQRAEDYPWCSVHHFTRTASPQFKKAVSQVKTDRLNVYDDF